MSLGYGDTVDELYGGGWGGAPMEGIELVQHMAGNAPWSACISEDTYLAMFILLGIAAMWLLGAIAFKGVRL